MTRNDETSTLCPSRQAVMLFEDVLLDGGAGGAGGTAFGGVVLNEYASVQRYMETRRRRGRDAVAGPYQREWGSSSLMNRHSPDWPLQQVQN
jgi:hypothetical protein